MSARQGFAGATCRGHHVIEMRDSVERLAVRLDIPDVLERSGRKHIIADFDTVWTRLARCCDENRTHTHVLAAVALTLTHITADMVLRPLLEAKGAELHARLPLLVQTQGSCDFTLLCGLILMPELIQQVHRTSQDLLRAVHAALLPIAPNIYKKNRNDAITALLTEGLVKSLPNGDALDVNVRRVTSAGIEGLLHLPAKMSPPVFRKFFCDVATWCYDQTSFGDPFSTPVVRFLIGTARAGDAISRRRALSTLLRMDTAENTDANMPIEYHPDPPKWDADRFWDCYRGVHEAMEDLAERTGGGDSYVLAHLIVATMQAIQKYASDGDELDLAKTLALLIREDPLSVSFEEETCSLRFGYERGLGPRQCGFPFDDWRDILLRCVSALDTLPPDEPVALPHDAGDFAVADVKDILLIQHAFLHGDLKQAVDIARIANARRPDDVFFHYALSLHMETSFDVRDVYSIVTDKYDRLDEADDPVATKTGTYCMMLRNISMAAFWFGMSIQFKEDYSKEEWGTVKFMVYAASTMADRYIEDYGRVDGRDKEMMVAVRFLAQTVMRAGLPAPGSRKAPLIGEVWEGQTAMGKGIWWGLRRHQKVHDVMDLFVREGNEAEDIWGRTLREMFPNHPTREDEVHPRFHAGASEVQVQWWKEVDVVMWARRWRNADRTTPVPWRFIPNPLILPLALPHYDSLHIHGCGGCTGRSSLARKCGACGEVAYCSKECQKKHWQTEHRELCSRALLVWDPASSQ